MRYVVDFYHDEGAAPSPEAAFRVDARPALDSPQAVLDRARMGIYVWCTRLGLPCPVTGAAPQLARPQQQPG